MLKKLRSKSGVARIIWILFAIVLILLCIIIIPLIDNFNENAKKRLDSDNEQTAWDSAYMRFIAEGSFESIYDLENKVFIDRPEGVKITGYGLSKENKDKVILVNCDGSGNVVLTWVDPSEYTRLAG